MNIDRRNRILLTLLALVLLALGVLGLLARYDVIAFRQPGSLWADLLGGLPRWGLLALVLLLGLLALVVGIALVTGQVGRRGARIGRLVLQDQPRGTTTFQSDGVGRVVARDAEQVPGVLDASASFVAAGSSPKLVLHATTDAAEDVTAIMAGLDRVLERVAGVLDVPGVRADVHLRPLVAPDDRIVR